jgi:small-conductance mechanosensitive channel
MAEYYADKTSRHGVNKHHLVFMLKKIIQIAVYASAIIVILYVFKVDLTGAIVGLGNRRHSHSFCATEHTQ